MYAYNYRLSVLSHICALWDQSTPGLVLSPVIIFPRSLSDWNTYDFLQTLFMSPVVRNRDSRCATAQLGNDRREKTILFLFPVSGGIALTQKSQVNRTGIRKAGRWSQTDTSPVPLLSHPVPRGALLRVLHASERFRLVSVSHRAIVLVKKEKSSFLLLCTLTLSELFSVGSKWKPLDWSCSRASSADLFTSSISFNDTKVKCRRLNCWFQIWLALQQHKHYLHHSPFKVPFYC